MSEGNGLPIGWTIETIPNLIADDGLFCDGDWVESKDQDADGDVRLIQLADIGDGCFRNRSARFLTSIKARELNCSYLEPGDVLIARMPDPLGRACIFPGDAKRCVTVVDVCIVRTGANNVDQRWLMWFVNSPHFRVRVAGKQSGSTRKRISRKNLARLPLNVPRPDEQRRIVTKIEELFSDLDAGAAALQRARANLKRYRAAVLKAAVEGRLTAAWRREHPDAEPADRLLARILAERRRRWEQDQFAKYQTQDIQPPKGWKEKYPEPAKPETSELPELPKGWCWATLSQIGILDRGRSRHRPRNAPHLYGGPYPFVQTGDVRHADTFIREYEQTYSEEGLKQSRLWPAGTLCITIAANIAETAILGFDGCFPDSVVGFLSVCEQVSVRYVELFLRTMQMRLESLAPATAQKNINLETLCYLAICVPPHREQIAIVEEADRCLSVANQVERQGEADLRKASRLRQSILKRAFDGRLVPHQSAPALDNVRIEGTLSPQQKSGRTARTVRRAGA